MTRMSASRMARCALFAALTAVCAQIIIPVGPVPVSLSLLPVILCGALLSPAESALSMAAYLLLGLAGAPVFSGLTGGAGKLLGPTGGYIVGYVPCALLIALTRDRLLKRLRHGEAERGGIAARVLPLVLAMANGILVCYLFGTAWFALSAGQTLSQTLSVCVWPFLPFDAAKIALAAAVSLRAAPAVKPRGKA